jgi:hypothetical protein
MTKFFNKNSLAIFYYCTHGKGKAIGQRRSFPRSKRAIKGGLIEKKRLRFLPAGPIVVPWLCHTGAFGFLFHCAWLNTGISRVGKQKKLNITRSNK